MNPPQFTLANQSIRHFCSRAALLAAATLATAGPSLTSAAGADCLGGGKADEVETEIASEKPAGVCDCSPARAPTFGVFESDETADGASIEPSQLLNEAIGGTARLSRADIKANALRVDQVKLAVLHDDSSRSTDRRELGKMSLDEVLTQVDGGEIFYGSGVVRGVEIDWVKFFSGDTEIGVVFAAGTLEIVAMIADGEIWGCGRSAHE